MRKLLVLGALLLMAAPAKAEKITEVVYMQCLDKETQMVKAQISVVKTGLKFTVDDAQVTISFQDLLLLEKVAAELAE